MLWMLLMSLKGWFEISKCEQTLLSVIPVAGKVLGVLPVVEYYVRILRVQYPNTKNLYYNMHIHLHI
jgi:hypothetical protein